MNVKVEGEWPDYEILPLEDYVQMYAKLLGMDKRLASFISRLVSVLVDRKLIGIDEFRIIFEDTHNNISFTEEDY